jgi:hypothetical protein
MLAMKRCPHTGVVNFFDTTDPLFAVGSIAQGRGRGKFQWRCYSGSDSHSGRVGDLKTAQHDLTACYEIATGHQDQRTYAV